MQPAQQRQDWTGCMAEERRVSGLVDGDKVVIVVDSPPRLDWTDTEDKIRKKIKELIHKNPCSK